MTQGPLGFQDVLRLVELIKTSTNFSEIRLRTADVELELRRIGPAAPTSALAPAATATRVPLPEQPPVPAPTPAPSPAGPAQAAAGEGMHLVTAPMVGTVYFAPEPGAAPFVQVGQPVGPDDQVCIVEVMKLMNSIPAGCRGVVREVLVADGEPVAFGQALFAIETR